MGSGVIYGAIVAVWAAVLVPMWLRRHDEATETRSVDRFSRAMRILSRREHVGDQRYVVMPARTSNSTGAVLSGPPGPWQSPRSARPAGPARSTGAGRQTRSARPGTPRGSADRARRASLAARRRRVLLGLLALTVLGSLLALVAGISWLVPLLGLLLLAGYLVHLRLQARRQVEITRRRARAARSADARMRRLDSAGRLVSTRMERLRGQTSATDAQPTAEAEPFEPFAPTAEEPGGWQPVPVPLPTYVTKPKALRTSRPIDLSGPQVSSAGRTMVEPEPSTEARPEDAEPTGQPAAGTPPPSAPSRTAARASIPFDQEQDDDELDAILEHRRAVND